jgi:Eco57I restriction-modification methylase
MLAGLSGHLLSHAFLEALVRANPPAAASTAASPALAVWRSRAVRCGPASTLRMLLQDGAAPLTHALGFDAPSDVRDSPAALTATLRHDRDIAALVVAPFGDRLEPLWRLAVTEAMRRSANWCLLFNGTHLRIVDATRVYARRSLEFDLDLATIDVAASAALWQTMSADALCDETGNSLRALVAASDRHAVGVCRSLRDGVLTASREVLDALAAGRPRSRVPPLGDSFEQALTIVYRLLFLLFAEARSLVPLWHPVYRDSYSVEALRTQAERSAQAPGLWEALRAMARLAHGGCRAGDLRMTPFNGRLFAPARTPLAERTDLDDGKARRAVLALSTRRAPDGSARERITYRDLGVEQLGAVYETLLDYEPHREASGAIALRADSGVRKATGTFYTLQPIAEYLVRRTIGPLIHDKTPDDILRLRIVDPAMGSGAFLVAACRYLANEYEASLIRSGHCHAADVSDADRVGFRRRIAERCLYGVDLNPMAVQLARLSLWLTTLAADRPLSFLDHRLQSGDSLLGAWLAQLRRPPAVRRRSTGADPLPLFVDDAAADALRDALPIRFSLESIPNDSLAQVRAKERAHAAATARDAALSRWKRIANLWCGTWFSSNGSTIPAALFGALADVMLHGTGPLPRQTSDAHLAVSDAIADARRFFHWELEFPEVFFNRDGSRLANAGFDAVIGNPPWDMIRADAGASNARALARPDTAAVLRFTRDAGVYRAQGDGHANRYQLFVERAIALTKAGGRMGLVLPSGLATDHGSAPLRRLLLSRCDVDAIVGLDNHRGVFPIHRSVRFLLVTASAGTATRSIACRLGVDDPAALESVGDEPAERLDWFPIRLSPQALDRISGPALTIPHLTCAMDLAIVERAASLFPVLGGSEGWSASFGRELNASDDRDAFRSDRRGLPVVDGKHLSPFRAAIEESTRSIASADARRLLRSNRHEHLRLAYRDVASATNRVTLIAAILPARCVSTHTVFCLRTPLPLRAQYFLCGVFNSLVVNYLVRLRVTTHVTTATVERLPIPTLDAAPAACADIASLARLLTRGEKPEAFAQLNARVAELYQLSAAEFEYVLGTFPLVESTERAGAMRVFLERLTRR